MRQITPIFHFYTLRKKKNRKPLVFLYFIGYRSGTVA